jgi:hypothetical protein
MTSSPPTSRSVRAGRLIANELGIWRSLLFMVVRRVPGRDPGVQAFPYAKEATPLMAAFIFVSIIELPIVGLLLPWPTVRLVVLLLSLWTVLWMLGLLATIRVHPHLLDDDGLRLRQGATTDIRIPWEAIATVSAHRGRIQTRERVHIEQGDDGPILNLPAMKRTRVDVALHRPTLLKLPGRVEEIAHVRLYADNPNAFIAAVRERLVSRRDVGQPTGQR